MKKINIFTTELKLTLFAVIFLVILKFFFVKSIDTILLTMLYDISIFGLLFSLFLYFKSSLIYIFFYFLYFLNYIIFSFYYIYFYDVSQRGALLTGVSLEAITFIFKSIISLKLILLIVFSFTIIILMSIYIYKNKKIYLEKKNVLLLILLCVFLFSTLFLVNVRTNPYADIVTNIKDSFRYIDLDSNNYLDKNLFISDKTIKDYSKENIKYKKILVFVGEEWMFSEYIENSNDSFFIKTSNNTYSYNNYYTSNQDSRTAIYTMLSSYFLPFEAYLDSTYSVYLNKIKEKNNLVDFFNINNYSTYFLVSSLQTPDIATPYNWTEISTLNKEVYNSNEYYCLDIFTYETACEDFSVLKDVKEIILNNENLFLFQEFIYGHSYKHIIDNKVSRTKYYNDYLNEVYLFLEENNLLDETLIIVTSDHGSRALNNMKSPDGYNVPLMFIANDIKKENDFSLLSHLDFKDILFKFIIDINNITVNDSVMFIGGTESNLVGFKKDNNNFGIINVSSSKLINYSLNNDSIKNISEEQFSFYKSLKNNFK